MEKRTLIAVALSIAVLLIWQFLVLGPQSERRREAAKLAEDARLERGGKDASAPTRTSRGKSEGFSQRRQSAMQRSESPAEQTIVAEPERLITVNTDLAEIVLSTRGGVIQQVNLKEHLTDDGKPLPLVLSQGNGKFPLYLAFGDERLNDEVNFSAYSVTTDGARTESMVLDSATPMGKLTFTYRGQSGLRVEKELVFYHDSYRIDLRLRVEAPNPQAYRLAWGPGMYPDIVEKGKEEEANQGEPAYFLDGKKKSSKPPENGVELHKGELLWTALENKYFVAAMIPKDNFNTAFVERLGERLYSAGLQATSQDLGVTKDITLYVGPKVMTRLSAHGVKLERIIDLGYFSFFARPLQRVLLFFYQYTHNYGVAIIILTLLIKLLFYPLTNKSFKSMSQMQKLQPRIKELQAQYKNDRQKLNQEMMGIYKQQGVNPLAGCLPMALQIPVFIALYNVLLNDIGLRHASFILWLTDLSTKDPYYVTPLIMGASMFFQQRMTPTTVDPAQAKMMMFMPVIFTFMFLNFPSGLVIYWLTNNILSIGQQMLINRKANRAAATT